MIGPLGGRPLRRVPQRPDTTPTALLGPLERVSGAICGSCGHRFVYHGDRAIGSSCDGGYDGKAMTTRSGPRGPLCDCKGWVRAVDETRRSA